MCVSALVLAACGSEEPSSAESSGGNGSTSAGSPAADPPQATHSAEAVAAADLKYKNVCAACHGMSGTGDTAIAKSFPDSPPRNYTSKEWQASVTDEYLAQVILEGGAAVGKSPIMVASPDLKDKPEVLSALVAKIRGFAE